MSDERDLTGIGNRQCIVHRGRSVIVEAGQAQTIDGVCRIILCIGGKRHQERGTQGENGKCRS